MQIEPTTPNLQWQPSEYVWVSIFLFLFSLFCLFSLIKLSLDLLLLFDFLSKWDKNEFVYVHFFFFFMRAQNPTLFRIESIYVKDKIDGLFFYIQHYGLVNFVYYNEQWFVKGLRDLKVSQTSFLFSKLSDLQTMCWYSDIAYNMVFKTKV